MLLSRTKPRNQQKCVVHVSCIKLTGDRSRWTVHLSNHILEAGKLLFQLGNVLWDGQEAQRLSKTPSKLCMLRNSNVDKVLKWLSAAEDDFEGVSHA